MTENTKIPQIRFKGFIDPWEQRKFENLFDYERPDNYIVKSDKYDENNQTPVLTANKGFILGYTNETSTYNQPCIIFDDFTLDSKYVDFNFMVKSSAMKILTAKNGINLQFAFERLNTANIENLGHSRHYISVVQPTETFVPNYAEQSRIAALCSVFDNLITLHQRKYEKLVNVKKSLLEKMFPTENEKVPKIRFKGYTDPWEQRKVKDVADRYDNLRIPVASNLRVSGTTPYYGANGIQDYVNGFTHEGEFVLVAEDGANDLKNYPVNCVKGRIWVNNHAHVLQGKQKICNNSFLAYLINRSNIETLLVGGGRAKLNSETLMNMDILKPKMEEQTKIGTLFQQLDNLITLHQSKLEKLKNIKKSLLEKMFV